LELPEGDQRRAGQSPCSKLNLKPLVDLVVGVRSITEQEIFGELSVREPGV